MHNKYKRRWKFKINLTYVAIIMIIIFSMIGVGYARFGETLKIKGFVTLVKNEEGNPSEYPIEVSFSTLYYDATQLHYSITVKNISGNDITNWRFKLGMPLGTKYQVWNSGNAIITENYFSGFTIVAGSSITLTGGITIPSGASLNDYLNPSITNVLVNYYDEDYPIEGENAGPIQKISLNVNNISIITGESYVLNVTREPKNAVGVIKWSSSNTNVAEIIGRGIIKGKGNGTAIITAKLENATASCVITVAENITPIEVNFSITNSWEQHMQYNIEVKNISNKAITNWRFKVEMPIGTTGSVYWGAVFLEGVFRGTDLNNIPVDGSISFSGELVLPSGYNINNYRKPAIIDINAE